MIAYTCDCQTTDPEHRLYLVTDHHGAVSLVRYCDECAELAQMDWNGETAQIEAVHAPHDAESYWQIVIGDQTPSAIASTLQNPTRPEIVDLLLRLEREAEACGACLLGAHTFRGIAVDQIHYALH